jgi:hypothetical protein
MERIKVSKYFHLDEFIDVHTYINESDNGLSKIDKNLFAIADFMREKYGAPLEINNWWYFMQTQLKFEKDIDKIITKIEKEPTVRKWSGTRTNRCTIGSPTSAHRLGKGVDMKGDSKKLDKIVKNNLKALHTLGLRRIEDVGITPGWLHLDTLAKNVGAKEIRIITKTTGSNISI